MRAALQICVLALSLAATGASAEATRTDFQILARALSFMESPPSGNVRIGIVYSSDDARTRRQAEATAEMLDGGMRVGNISLEAALVAIEDAADADVDFFFVLDSFRGELDEIAAASSKRRLPCVTTDIDRVREGACTLGVRSQPKVEILVNRTMAEKTGARFATAFRMMITEI